MQSAAGRKKSKRKTKGLLVRNELSYFVLVPTIAMLLIGLVMVFSAGSAIGVNIGRGGYMLFAWQCGWALLGFGLMVILSRIDYHKLAKVSWLAVLVSVVLLVLVPIMGKEVGGARRWLAVGGFTVQPTEIAKFALVIFAAYALALRGDKVKRFVHLVVPVLLLAVLEAGLIMLQPDMGSTIVMCLSVMVMLVICKSKASHLVLIGGVGVTASVAMMFAAPYRRARLLSFINPWSSPRGAGYHVIQSYIALGTGHIKGVGLGMSRQKFLYLPNAHTDFIFAIIGEELGILGTMVVVCLVALLGYAGWRIARRAPDELGRLLAAGITSLIVIQALVNMGGVTGLLPITGVPLPLVSFGGSSLCACMACIGILLNVAAQCRNR